MAELTIETRRQGDDSVVLALSGDFDLAAIEKFETILRGVEAEAPGAIVIDLGQLDFMDSSGLRALVLADRRARSAERRLAIIPGPPTVRRVFEITQLDQELELLDG